MGERLWTEFIRDTAPLESLLRERARSARADAGALNLHQVRAEAVDETVDRLLATWSEFAQPLTVGEVRPYHEPEEVDRHDREGPERYSYWRWYYRVELSGDIEIVERWPAPFDEPPLSADDQFHPASGPWMRSTNSAVLLLADVSRADDPHGEQAPTEQIEWVAGYLRAAVAASNAQVAAYDQALREELTETVTLRRERLERIAHGNVEVVSLVRDQLGPIELVEADDGPIVELAVAGPEPLAPAPVDLRYALYGASASDLQTAVRKWRDSVEAYPATFVKLDEEDISSVLITTLNAVFDSAHREVFRAAGKTDIYVQAHVGQYDEAAHIAEAKIWGGQAEVAADLGQLLGYATARTESQLLLYYVRNQNLGLIAGRCADALAAHSIGGKLERHDRFDVALTVEHPDHASPIALTVMFVHLPTADAVDPDAPAA